MPEFLPGQRAELRVLDVVSGHSRVVFSSTEFFFEAPNWSPDGEWLVVNAEGGLFRLPAPDRAERAAERPGPADRAPAPDLVDPDARPERVDLAATPVLNNDHVVAPDGRSFLLTARDGHLYEVPWEGGRSRRITPDAPAERRFKYYLHGVSPDGRTLAAIGGGLDASGRWVTNVYTLPVAGGEHSQLTDDAFADDGVEFSADGSELWFNSEREADYPGHAQLFRMRADGSALTRMSHDDRVNWFPHPSPDGQHVLYLSYPRGTTGHPPNLDVELRLIELATGRMRTVASFFGGQGSSNVPGWSPDGRRLAYVAYPV